MQKEDPHKGRGVTSGAFEVLINAAMMLTYPGWVEAAGLIETALASAIAGQVVTYDLARLMDGATEVGTSGFAAIMVGRMG